jgi:hypothetical protein
MRGHNKSNTLSEYPVGYFAKIADTKSAKTHRFMAKKILSSPKEKAT